MAQSLSNQPIGVYSPVVMYNSISTDTTLNWSNLGQGRVDEYRETLAASLAITLTGAREGQFCTLSLIQDATGNKSVTWGAEVSFDTIGGPPTLSTTGDAEDTLFFIYNATTGIYKCVGFIISTGTTTTLEKLYAVGNTTLASSGQNQPGSLTFSGAGNISVGITDSKVVISSPLTMNMFAIGNTTASSSSTTRNLSVDSISGAGNVSVGFSGNTIVISGSAAVSATSMGLSAIGNTTANSSSTTRALTTEVFSGAGNVSVGFSNGTIVISGSSGAQSVQTLGLYASGNTTGATSSTTLDARSITLYGSNLVSLGFSNGSILYNATSGTVIASASTAGTAVSGGGLVHFYYEPVPWGTFTSDFISENIGSCVLQAGTISFNLIRLFASRRNNLCTLSIGTSNVTGSTSFTGSGGWSNTISFVLYSSSALNVFASLFSTTGTISSGAKYTVTRSSNSVTARVSHEYQWYNGTVTSSFGTTFSATTNTTTAFQGSIGPIVGFSNNMHYDIPCNSNFTAGIYLYGFLGSTATATAREVTSITVAAGAWSAGYCHCVGTSGFYPSNLDGTFGFYFNKWGTATSLGGIPATSINWLNIGSSGAVAGSVFAPCVNFMSV